MVFSKIKCKLFIFNIYSIGWKKWNLTIYFKYIVSLNSRYCVITTIE